MDVGRGRREHPYALAAVTCMSSMQSHAHKTIAVIVYFAKVRIFCETMHPENNIAPSAPYVCRGAICLISVLSSKLTYKYHVMK